MTPTQPPVFNGVPLATPEQSRTAVMLGRFLHRSEGMAFYEYDGKVFVVESGKPPSIHRQSNK